MDPVTSAALIGGTTSLISGAVSSAMQRSNQELSMERAREQARKLPSAEVEGLRRAGINPMLAYSNIDFSAQAPHAYGPHVDLGSNIASAGQIQTLPGQIELQSQSIRQASAQADITEATASLTTATVRAIAEDTGFMRFVSDPKTDALSSWIRLNRVMPERAAALARRLENENVSSLQDFINMPAANAAMAAAQAIYKGYLAQRGSSTVRETQLPDGGTFRTTTERK